MKSRDVSSLRPAVAGLRLGRRFAQFATGRIRRGGHDRMMSKTLLGTLGLIQAQRPPGLGVGLLASRLVDCCLLVSSGPNAANAAAPSRATIKVVIFIFSS